MSRLLFDDIVLSESESRALVNRLINPNQEYLEKRNRLFDEADENIFFNVEGEDLIVNVPGLDLSCFIDDDSISAPVQMDQEDTYIYLVNSNSTPVKSISDSFFFDDWHFNDYKADGSFIPTYKYAKEIEEEIEAPIDGIYGIAA